MVAEAECDRVLCLYLNLYKLNSAQNDELD